MIRVSQLTLARGGFQLRNVSFEIPTGSYAVLMGATGCGKTSVLECIAGLVPAVSGSIRIGDHDVTRLPAAERQLGYVPQDGALFAGLGVWENMAFALRIRGMKESVVKERVTGIAAQLGIPHLLERGVRGLSGGERQRVALGRALAFRPRVMLLDEPLGALDESSREAMCALLEGIHRETGTTFLHVTHSPAEAERLATVRLDALDLFRTP